MAKAIAAGFPKQRIQEAAARTQSRIDSGKQIIVGLNRYRPARDEAVKVLKVDNGSVRDAQLRRLQKIKSERDNTKVQAALNALTECAKSGQGNLLHLTVQAARAQATVGEMGAALERVFGRHAAEERLVANVYLAEFGEDDPQILEVQNRVRKFAHQHGRQPRIFICKLGQDGHDRGQDVVGAALHDMGFDVVLGPLFQTPEEAAQQAIEQQVDIVSMSSLAAGHLILMPALKKCMTEMGHDELPIVIGGVIPPQDYAELRSYGVRAIFGPGTVLPAAAKELLDILINDAQSPRAFPAGSPTP